VRRSASRYHSAAPGHSSPQEQGYIVVGVFAGFATRLRAEEDQRSSIVTGGVYDYGSIVPLNRSFAKVAGCWLAAGWLANRSAGQGAA
jgi:hypothetical protein